MKKGGFLTDGVVVLTGLNVLGWTVSGLGEGVVVVLVVGRGVGLTTGGPALRVGPGTGGRTGPPVRAVWSRLFILVVLAGDWVGWRVSTSVMNKIYTGYVSV